jgi:N-acetylglutamate synthase-like GNAT family acetyltransferase
VTLISADGNRIQISAFAAADQAGVIDVVLPIQQDEFGVPITVADQPDLGAIETFYQSGLGGFWVAKVDGRVVGTIALKDIGGREAALRKMFVAAPYRGPAFGTAKQLLDTLLTEAAKRGIRRIFLGTTDKFVAAHRFYEKNGFVEVARGDLPASFPLMAVDSRFYKVELAAGETVGRPGKA